MSSILVTGHQTGGVQGSVNVSGQGKVYGTAVGVNTGTITGGTYTFTDDDEKGKGLAQSSCN